jgi:hypothetical protein
MHAISSIFEMILKALPNWGAFFILLYLYSRLE